MFSAGFLNSRSDNDQQAEVWRLMVSFGGLQTGVSLSAVTSLLCVSGHGLTWSCDVLTGFQCIPVGPSLALALGDLMSLGPKNSMLTN